MLTRRTMIAALLTATAQAAHAQGSDPARQGQNGRTQQPAQVIDHPRASHFDIGPADKPWRIFLGLPDAPAPAAGYGAILSLDGNSTFPALWQHRERHYPDAPVLLVGIGYPVATRLDRQRRWFDLTSPGKAAVPQQPGQRGPGTHPTGGQQALLQMIRLTLLTELSRKVALNARDLTLFGHSLGGLFVLNALLTEPGLFARYAAADPSTWWNAGEPLREARAFGAAVHATGAPLRPEIALLISQSGGRDNAIVPVLSDIPGLHLTSRRHPGESHGSVMPIGAAEALALHLGKLDG